MALTNAESAILYNVAGAGSRRPWRSRCFLLASRKSSFNGAFTISSPRSPRLLEQREVSGVQMEESFIIRNKKPAAVEAAIVLVLGAGTCGDTVTIAQKLNEIRSKGGLGISIATKPFKFEGHKRLVKAEQTLVTLQSASDLLLVIEHDTLLSMDGITVLEASRISNDIVSLAVQTVTALVSGHSMFYDRPVGAKEVGDSDMVLPFLGKGNLRYGRGFSMEEAVRQAFLMLPLSETEKNGFVICGLTKPTGLRKSGIKSLVATLRSFLGPDATIIFSPIQENITMDIQPVVIITGPTYDNEQKDILGVSEQVSHLDIVHENERVSTKGEDSRKILESHEVKAASTKYVEVQADKLGNILQPLPYDPAAVPHTSVLKMGIEAVLDVCKTVIKDKKEPFKEPSLSQRAASMLEQERTSRNLPP